MVSIVFLVGVTRTVARCLCFSGLLDIAAQLRSNFQALIFQDIGLVRLNKTGGFGLVVWSWGQGLVFCLKLDFFD